MLTWVKNTYVFIYLTRKPTVHVSCSTAARPLCPLFPHMSERKAAYVLQNLSPVIHLRIFLVNVQRGCVGRSSSSRGFSGRSQLIFISVIVTVGGNSELPLQPRRPGPSDLTAEWNLTAVLSESEPAWTPACVSPCNGPIYAALSFQTERMWCRKCFQQPRTTCCHPLLIWYELDLVRNKLRFDKWTVHRWDIELAIF